MIPLDSEQLHQLVENCNDYDGWYCNGNTREYRDYYCSGGACTYSVTDTKWTNTGNTRNKPEGAICGCTASNTLKRCYGGVCTGTGICDSSICGADASCNGKVPGESCGGGTCDSNCKCGVPGTVSDCGIYRNGQWILRTSGSVIYIF